MNRFGKVVAALLTAALVLLGTSARAEITASVDRHQAALGDTLRLTISATDGEDIGDIDLSPLEQDFELLGRSMSTNTSIINGRYSSSVDLSLDITPRRQGTLTIPALQLGSRATNSLQIAVGAPPSGGGGNEPVVFEAEIDRDSVYVQGQVILTLRVQEAINLEDRSITELQLDNAFVHTLEQQSFRRTINGRPWIVHEVRYAIFPEQSGTLTIPVQTYSARERDPRRSIFDMGSGRQLRRQTEALQVEVLPRPAGYPNADWLPAQELTVQENWSTPPEQLRVGESATRTVTIRGLGLQGAQLPPILYPATRGLKFYPDQPEITDGEAATGLVGTRVDSVAIVPTEAGNWSIPELRIPWWDTSSNELRYAVLPARELTVAPAGPATVPDRPAARVAAAPDIDTTTAPPAINTAGASADQSRLWQIVSAVTALGWLLTLAYLVRSRRRAAPARSATGTVQASESRAFKAALATCASGDAANARQAVIAWSARLAPQRPPLSLAQVAALFDEPELTAALENLDKALYSDTGATWDGTVLAQCLRQVRSRNAADNRSDEQELQLYPQGA
jgi:hypothetical protein